MISDILEFREDKSYLILQQDQQKTLNNLMAQNVDHKKYILNQISKLIASKLGLESNIEVYHGYPQKQVFLDVKLGSKMIINRRKVYHLFHTYCTENQIIHSMMGTKDLSYDWCSFYIYFPIDLLITRKVFCKKCFNLTDYHGLCTLCDHGIGLCDECAFYGEPSESCVNCF